MSSGPILLWYRQDLRVGDHPALRAAHESGRPVIPLYIWHDDESADPITRVGGAGRWWLHHSLAALAATLESRESRLIIRSGAPCAVLRDLVDETGATAIHFTRRYEPDQIELEQRVKDELSGPSLEIKRFGGALLREPGDVETKTGGPYKVFTPYYKECLRRASPKNPVHGPGELTRPANWPDSLELGALELLPSDPNWAEGWQDLWTPGEDAARDRLRDFLDGPIESYHTERDRPDHHGTSKLSPHLHWGEVSPRWVWHETLDHFGVDDHGALGEGAQTFLQEVIWREFSYHLLGHFPHIPRTAFKPEFEAFPWQEDDAALKAWQRGKTGYPIVDAGMRQLYATGWMHNRVRMITGSFLIKHLLQPWQAGELWFSDCLVDADLASNSAGWQWVAGSGADASPFFRIFNPITQAEKFDPGGAYIRKWVPELAKLPDSKIGKPWEASDAELAQSDVVLGETYPKPIVEHSKARERALDAYDVVKANK